MKKLLAFCAIAAAVMMMTGCEPYSSPEESLNNIPYLNAAKFNSPVEETIAQPSFSERERHGAEHHHSLGSGAIMRGEGEGHEHEGGYSSRER